MAVVVEEIISKSVEVTYTFVSQRKYSENPKEQAHGILWLLLGED